MYIQVSQVVGNTLSSLDCDSTDLLNVRYNGSLGHDVKQLDLLYHFLFTVTLMGTQKTHNIIIGIAIVEILQLLMSAFGSRLASLSFLYLFINHSFFTPFLCPCSSRVRADRKGRKRQRKCQ